jgi:hypothetical protein
MADATAGDLTDTKSILLSKTFWGALIGLAASGASLIGYVMTPADTAHAIDAITGIAGGVGSLLAIVGRVYATKQVAMPTIKF